MTKLFDRFQLKFIAIFFMLINHVGTVILTNGIMMNATHQNISNNAYNMIVNLAETFHIVGRITFPIFCFFIVEGFFYTHDLKNYLKRLFFIGLISEIPYNLAMSGQLISIQQQNVMFELLLGLLLISFLSRFHNQVFIDLIAICFFGLLAYFLRIDGGYYGIGLISIFYLFRKRTFSMFFLACLWAFVSGFFTFDMPFIFSMIGILLCAFYNGKKGKNWNSFFYWFYPIHLVILFLLSKCLVSFFLS